MSTAASYEAKLKAIEEAERRKKLDAEKERREAADRAEAMARKLAELARKSEERERAGGVKRKREREDEEKEKKEKEKSDTSKDKDTSKKDTPPPRNRKNLSFEQLMAMAAQTAPEELTLGRQIAAAQEKERAAIKAIGSERSNDNANDNDDERPSPSLPHKSPKPNLNFHPSRLEATAKSTAIFSSKPSLKPPIPRSNSASPGPNKPSKPALQKGKMKIQPIEPGVELTMLQVEKRDLRSVAELVEEKFAAAKRNGDSNGKKVEVKSEKSWSNAKPMDAKGSLKPPPKSASPPSKSKSSSASSKLSQPTSKSSLPPPPSKSAPKPNPLSSQKPDPRRSSSQQPSRPRTTTTSTPTSTSKPRENDWRSELDAVLNNYRGRYASNAGPGGGGRSDSDLSDMEAGADDILREERRSRALAIREDIEQERLEKEMERREREAKRAAKKARKGKD